MATKEETKKAEREAEAEQMTGGGPEQTGQQNAATLQEAMEMQDRLAREKNGTTEPVEEPAPPEE